MCCQSDIHHRHCTAVSSAGLLPPSPVCHWKSRYARHRPCPAPPVPVLQERNQSHRRNGSGCLPQYLSFAPDTLPRQREDALHRQTLLPAPPAPVYPSSEAGGPPYPWYPPRNATTSLRRCLHSASGHGWATPDKSQRTPGWECAARKMTGLIPAPAGGSPPQPARCTDAGYPQGYPLPHRTWKTRSPALPYSRESPC